MRSRARLPSGPPTSARLNVSELRLASQANSRLRTGVGPSLGSVDSGRSGHTVGFAFALVAASVVTGCATARVSQSQISSIVVYEKGAVIPSNCTIIRSATERDGVESDGLVEARNGSRDRVIQRLKKRAASVRADALAIQQDAGQMCVDCNGAVVEIRVDLLRCGPLDRDL